MSDGIKYVGANNTKSAMTWTVLTGKLHYAILWCNVFKALSIRFGLKIRLKISLQKNLSWLISRLLYRKLSLFLGIFPKFLYEVIIMQIMRNKFLID